MVASKKTIIILVMLIVYVITIVGMVMYLAFDKIEPQNERDQIIVPAIPDTMIYFWELNDTFNITMIEGRVVDSMVRPAERIDHMPLHNITIQNNEGENHVFEMIFDMEPNTFFRSYHNPIIFNYYMQFVCEEIEDNIYRCFYYRHIYEYQ